ncbi:MAG: hypothetical protein IMY74_09730 [Bacteroidetes bacterium]|nr:hypothetical protein [Bacteroidota bacterium]
MIQHFEAGFDPASGMTTLEQLAALLKQFDIRQKSDAEAVMSEIVKFLPAGDGKEKFLFQISEESTDCRMFNHGCDYIVKHFDEEFDNAFD